MPKIVEEIPYNGVQRKAKRLGLNTLVDEVRDLITGFKLLVKEERDSNGSAVVRKLLDERFRAARWVKASRPEDVDWTKNITVNGTNLCVGVEIQVSGRSDSGLVMDVVHLKREISEGRMDVGIIVVPTDKLSHYLTDRTPSISSARMHVEQAEATRYAIILMSIAHDGAGPSLPKRPKAQAGSKQQP